MDGLVVVDKPRGFTSGQVIYRIRKLTGQKKSGHAGTLDPAAEGVLLVCLGKATKLVEHLMGLPKVYRTTARLDVTSASFDKGANVRPVAVDRRPDRAEMAAALATFEGEIDQIPPMVSALKVRGRPAYDLVRCGKPPVLAPRRVRVYRIGLGAYEWPTVEFEMACGRGTYVRAVVRDLGERLGTGGCVTALVRTQVGPFSRATAWSLDALAGAVKSGADWLLSVDDVREKTASDYGFGSVPPPE